MNVYKKLDKLEAAYRKEQRKFYSLKRRVMNSKRYNEKDVKEMQKSYELFIKKNDRFSDFLARLVGAGLY